MYITHPGSVEIGYNELATLKHLAVTDSLVGRISTSCSELAAELDISPQTVSRRLQRLEETDLLERTVTPDGQAIRITPEGRDALLAEYREYQRVFEDDMTLDLDGIVTSGLGEGKHYISLSGYMDQFESRLGYEPYPGTLNLEVTDGPSVRGGQLEPYRSVTVDGWADDERTYGPVTCHPVTVRAGGETYEQAHFLDIERTHHDDEIVEVIAKDRLRDALDLEDGAEVTLEFAFEGW